MTSVATETVGNRSFNPSLGAGVATNPDMSEVLKLKEQLKQADRATGEAMKELEFERTKSAAAHDKLNRVEKELKKLKKIISIMQESGKLDAKKFAAAEKFVSEFFE